MYFCLIYVYFASAYFDHEASMHHAIRLLDSPGNVFGGCLSLVTV